LDDELRRLIWPILLHIYPENELETSNEEFVMIEKNGLRRPSLTRIPFIPSTNIDEESENYLEKIRDEILKVGKGKPIKKVEAWMGDIQDVGPIPESDYSSQVALDVERSFTHGFNASQRAILQPKLNWLILHVLGRNTYLHYFQGFHDLCSVILLVFGPTKLAIRVTETLCQFWWRDHMHPTLDSSLRHLHLLYPLLARMDFDLSEFINLANSNVHSDHSRAMLLHGTVDPRPLEPFFAISWILTWCSHDITSWTNLKRLFDYFIAHPPLMPVYFAAQAVVSQRELVLALNSDDASSMHKKLLTFPQDIPLEYLIRKSRETWTSIEPLSLLQTAEKLQQESIKDGRRLNVEVEEHGLDGSSCAHPHRHQLDVVLIPPTDPLNPQTAYYWFTKAPKGGKKREADFLDRYRLRQVGNVVKWGALGTMALIAIGSLLSS
jgi:hypothetical protein